MARAEASESIGQQRDGVLVDVARVDTGVGHHEAGPRLHDAGAATRGDHAHHLAVDRGKPGGLAVVAGRDQPAFGLADDLRRHDDDVTV